MVTLVLASASPARLATLQAAGIEPLVVVSDVDEDAALAVARAQAGHELSVPTQVAELALAKARDVVGKVDRSSLPGEVLVLGCDSLLEVDGVAQGKPWEPDIARERWRAMRGGTGVLHTGHYLVRLPLAGEPRMVSAVSSTQVSFADLDDDEIDAYVATGEPLQVAGAFTIDGIGGAFITAISGDHHGVVGLSLPVLRSLVRELGLRYPDLWENVRLSPTN